MRTRNAITIVLAIAMIFTLTAAANAAAYTWDDDGGVDDTWNYDPGTGFYTNWDLLGSDPAVLPGASDSVTFANILGNGTIYAVDMNGLTLAVQDMFISGVADTFNIGGTGSLAVTNLNHDSAAAAGNTISGTLSIANSGKIDVSAGTLSISGALTMGTSSEIVVSAGTLNISNAAANTDNASLDVSGGHINVSGVTAPKFSYLADLTDSGAITSDSNVTVTGVDLIDGWFDLTAGKTFTYNGGGSTLHAVATDTTLPIAGAVTIAVDAGSTYRAAYLSTQDDSTLNVGGDGAQLYDTIAVWGGAGSTTTLNFTGAGTLTAKDFNDTLGGGTNMVVDIKQTGGSGTFTLDTTASGSVIAGNTTFKAGAGTTFKALGAAPLGAGSTISFDGGTFETEGAASLGYNYNQLWLTRYNSGTNNNSPAELDDGVDGNGLNGGVFNLTPDNGGGLGEAWTDTLQGPELGGADNYCEMYFGNFHSPVSGTVRFKQWADDYEAIWLDINQNGEFEASLGEAILLNVPPEGWNTTKEGDTPALVAGQAYAFAAIFREDGGGDNSQFQIDMDMGAGTNFKYIEPGHVDQDGYWSTSDIIYGDIAMGSTDIVVDAATDTSKIIATTSGTATFGSLDIQSGLLTVSGAEGGTIFSGNTSIAAGATGGVTSANALTLGNLNIGNGATFKIGSPSNTSLMTVDTVATVEATGVFNVTAYDDGAGASLTKTGSGTMNMPTTGAENTTFHAAAGTLAFSDGTVGGSTADLNLEGGTIKITAETVLGYIPLTWDFEGDLNGWTVIPTGAAGNDDNAFADGRNPNGRENRQQHGDYHISTRNLSNPNNDWDNHEGILESPWFIVGDQGGGEEVSFLAGGGD
nr:hypothetical protein [Planctomycetota bacterium]